MKDKIYFAASPGQTKKVGREMAQDILRSGPKGEAVVLGLRGELGGGKTTFLQGFANGLGIKDKILSPTFVIYRKSQIPSNFQFFYHFDCYRIQKPKDLLDLGLKEIISNPQNIVAIEWADKIKKILPKNTLWLKFEFIDEEKRKITIGV